MEEKIDLLPTGTCFDDALDFISKAVKTAKTARERLKVIDTLILAHGIMQAKTGKLYAHAWVEEGSICWHSSYLNGELVYAGIERRNYYKSSNLQECTYYSVRDACEENLKSNHYGPWVEKYTLLCKANSKSGREPRR